MKKIFFITLVCFLAAVSALAEEPEKLLAALKRSEPDSNRINIQLALSHYYLFKPKEEQVDLNASLAFSTAAFELSKKLKLEEFSFRALKMKAALHMEIRNIQKAEELFSLVAAYYHKRDPLKEAALWIFYADMISSQDLPNQYIRYRAISKAYLIYRDQHKPLQATNMLYFLGAMQLHKNELNDAEKTLRIVISKYKSLKYAKIYEAQYVMTLVYYRKNEYKKSLISAIETLKNYENDPNKDPGSWFGYNANLGTIYALNGNFKEAININLKGIAQADAANEQGNYFVMVNRLVKSYVQTAEFEQADRLLQKAMKRFPSMSVQDEARLRSAALNLLVYRKDDRAVRAMIPEFKKTMQKHYDGLLGSAEFTAPGNYINLYEPLLKFHLDAKHWTELSEEMKLIRSLPDMNLAMPIKIKLNNINYKLDSVQGRATDALQRFQVMTEMKDSLTRLNNSELLDELEAKYRSVSKDKTIKTLSSEATLQQSRLANINLQRNITFAGVVVVIFIAIFIYIAFRNKQKNNEVLKLKQSEINAQNKILTGLIKEKEKLLEDKDILLIQQRGLVEEKEWLIKEVHHRVKNNLQIVMSLLYTQSAYLQSIDAVEAIRDVQHRVQAISIIHQKLYQKTGGSAVTISDYINEIVSYLSNSYNISARNIRFEQIIPAVNLDISQAVPMGLIINEAITNALKYAFGDKPGKIMIKGILNNDRSLLLSISDNGVGLPKNFDVQKTSSLGMEMMKALGKQLGGNFCMRSNGGVEISISFKIDRVKVANLENSLL